MKDYFKNVKNWIIFSGDLNTLADGSAISWVKFKLISPPAIFEIFKQLTHIVFNYECYYHFTDTQETVINKEITFGIFETEPNC